MNIITEEIQGDSTTRNIGLCKNDNDLIYNDTISMTTDWDGDH